MTDRDLLIVHWYIFDTFLIVLIVYHMNQLDELTVLSSRSVTRSEKEDIFVQSVDLFLWIIIFKEVHGVYQHFSIPSSLRGLLQLPLSILFLSKLLAITVWPPLSPPLLFLFCPTLPPLWAADPKGTMSLRTKGNFPSIRTNKQTSERVNERPSGPPRLQPPRPQLPDPPGP